MATMETMSYPYDGYASAEQNVYYQYMPDDSYYSSYEEIESPVTNGEAALSPHPGQLLLKILIPGYAAGAVIGKGGQIIVQLQKESGAIIKLSKAKDFYPGTQDRVVLIQGTAEGLVKVHTSIIEKVHDFPVPKDLAALIGDRPNQVKIIVPNTTAGLVIGKAGATVKTIMDESGAKIQLSQKPDGLNVQERVITIKGDKRQLVAASNIIIEKIKDDPQSASCPTLSYAGITGPVANANPTGSPYAVGPTLVDGTHPALQAMLGHYVISGHPSVLQTSLPASHLLAHHHTIPAALSVPAADLTALNGGLAGLASPYGLNYNALSVVPGLHSNMHSGAASLSVISAGTLNPAPSATPLLPTAQLQVENGAIVQGAQALSLPRSYLAGPTSTGYLQTGHQLVNTPVGVAGSTGSSPHPAQPATPSNLSAASGSSTPAFATSTSSAPSIVSVLGVEKCSDGLKETVELSIPESLIGTILGKAGRTLVEYQDISGAKIQISKKGEYVIGTRNRKVTITGKPPSPQTAQLLITQRVLSAQAARTQQAKLLH